MELLNEIRELAGVQRANTFVRVARAALLMGAKRYVETGCYRGIHWDGQSTLIWAKLAEVTGGHVVAIDISQDSIDRASTLLGPWNKYVDLVLADSLHGLKDIEEPIDVLYLDSFDHDPSNPEPCQIHQMQEALIALPKMAQASIVMLDDCAFSTGGKAKLSDPVIRNAGWKVVAQEYQNVYQRSCDSFL